MGDSTDECIKSTIPPKKKKTTVIVSNLFSSEVSMLINVLAPWLVFCGVFVVSPSMPHLWLVTARNLWKSGKFTKKFSTSEKKGGSLYNSFYKNMWHTCG